MELHGVRDRRERCDVVCDGQVLLRDVWRQYAEVYADAWNERPRGLPLARVVGTDLAQNPPETVPRVPLSARRQST
jgi:hypothetical protein